MLPNDWLNVSLNELNSFLKAWVGSSVFCCLLRIKKNITEMLPKHNTDRSPLSRHTVVYIIDVDLDKGTADSVSSLAVYQTQLDGINSHVLAGESNLFMVGKYRDKFILNNGKPKFIERITQLDTRRLDKGSHWPI